MTIDSKQYDKQAEKRTIVDSPDVEERRSPSAHPVVLQVATAAQTITPWGYDFRRRDAELRSFWISEPWLASAVYLVSIRNASFSWEVIGSDPTKPRPKNTINAVTRLLNRSDRGAGWKKLLLKTCIDLYTQDNGAFWEIIRKNKKPNAPVVNVAHLDAARCWRTGDPEYPVIYKDRYGKERVLRWWEVQTIEEFPSPYEDAFGVQYCAVTRALLAAEIVQSIAVYKQEKIGGTFTRAIDAISGLTHQNIQDAIAAAAEQSLNRGLYRFSLPVIVPTIDPTSSLSHVHIDLASLPDNFDEDVSLKWYVAQLAAAFGVDYQEIAPLMTGNLGSSQQSEIMHLKTRGKGPALIMGLIEDVLNNNGILPSNVEFRFLEQDLRSETEKANARFTRSKDRMMRVESGELDGQAARELAVLDGDLPVWLANEIEERGVAQPLVEARPDESAMNTGIESQRDKRWTAEDVQDIRDSLRVDPVYFKDTKYALDD